MSDLTTTMAPAPATEPTPQFQQVTKTGTNGLAVTSLVLSILWFWGLGSVLAVIFGAIALKQTKENVGQGGRGLAIAGLVIGIVGIAGAVVLTIIVVAAGAAASDASTAIDAYTRCIDAAQTAAQVSAC